MHLVNLIFDFSTIHEDDPCIEQREICSLKSRALPIGGTVNLSVLQFYQS